jgi:hypothetical protein
MVSRSLYSVLQSGVVPIWYHAYTALSLYGNMPTGIMAIWYRVYTVSILDIMPIQRKAYPVLCLYGTGIMLMLHYIMPIRCRAYTFSAYTVSSLN